MLGRQYMGKPSLSNFGSQFRPTLQFPPVALNDGSVILPSKYARNIGVTFDSVLNFESHITDICKSCYFNIRNIYRIRKFLSTEHTKILVNAFVTSRLDNCNSLLFGLPCSLLHKLQLVQNCAARLTLGGGKYDHITPLLRELHWLPVEHRITFKLLLKGPSQPHFCFCLHARVWLLHFIRSMSSRRKSLSNN